MANVYVGKEVRWWEVKNWEVKKGKWSTKYVMKRGLSKHFMDRHPQLAKKESDWMEDVRNWTPDGECLDEGKL